MTRWGSIFRWQHTKHLFEVGGESFVGVIAHTVGNFADGHVGVAEQLGGTFQAHVADEVGGRDAQHVTQLGVQGRAAHENVLRQLVHAVVCIGEMPLYGFHHAFGQGLLFMVHSYFLRINAGVFGKLMAGFLAQFKELVHASVVFALQLPTLALEV